MQGTRMAAVVGVTLTGLLVGCTPTGVDDER